MVVKQALRRKPHMGHDHKKKEHKELKKLIKAASRHLTARKNTHCARRIDVINTIINDSENAQLIDDKMPIKFELVRSLPAWQITDEVYLIPKLKRLAVAETNEPCRVVTSKYLMRSPLWATSKVPIIEALHRLAH